MKYTSPNDYDKEINILDYLLGGYLCFCDHEHPLAYGNGLVALHRHIASITEGKWVSSSEHVHHKDENKFNNDPDNLEILTAADHIKKHIDILLERRGHKRLEYCVCINCEKVFKPKSSLDPNIYCSNECRTFCSRKVLRPSKEELTLLIWQFSTVKIGKMFGVSDKAIEKWCKSYCIVKPPRGYWAKVYARKITTE